MTSTHVEEEIEKQLQHRLALNKNKFAEDHAL